MHPSPHPRSDPNSPALPLPELLPQCPVSPMPGSPSAQHPQYPRPARHPRVPRHCRPAPRARPGGEGGEGGQWEGGSRGSGVRAGRWVGRGSGRAGLCRNAPRYKQRGRHRAGGAARPARIAPGAQPRSAQLSSAQPRSAQISSGTPGRTQVSASRAGSAERLRICARLRRSRQGQARSGRSTAPQSPVLWRALRGPIHIVIREDRAPQTPGLPRVSSGSCPQFGQKAKAPLGRRRALGAATPPHQGPARRSPGTSAGKFLSLSSL